MTTIFTKPVSTEIQDLNGRITLLENQSPQITKIEPSVANSQLNLSASSNYEITAADSSFVFTTPPNTTYTAITDAEIDSIWSSS